eukprot:573217-Amphidinium_carterae.1
MIKTNKHTQKKLEKTAPSASADRAPSWERAPLTGLLLSGSVASQEAAANGARQAVEKPASCLTTRNTRGAQDSAQATLFKRLDRKRNLVKALQD